MPTIKVGRRLVRFCVLIPSCGRSDRLRRTLTRMAFLNNPDTIIGIHMDQASDYAWLVKASETWQGQTIVYPNSWGSVAIAREQLRQAAVAQNYDYYVVTDDNATYDERSVTELVTTCHEYRTVNRRECTMAGLHNTAPHFDRRLIQQTTAILPSDRKTYANVAMIFQCYPHALYSQYKYPPDAYGLDDRHFYLWCIAHQVRDFRVCMSAPFNKARYEKGGQGDILARARKNGLAIARLATDFPDMVGAAGTLRIPWQLILRLRAGDIADRLAGGSMRKEDALVRSVSRSMSVSVPVRRVR